MAKHYQVVTLRLPRGEVGASKILSDFTHIVELLLQDGWELNGNVSIAATDNYTVLAQSVTKDGEVFYPLSLPATSE